MRYLSKPLCSTVPELGGGIPTPKSIKCRARFPSQCLANAFQKFHHGWVKKWPLSSMKITEISSTDRWLTEHSRPFHPSWPSPPRLGEGHLHCPSHSQAAASLILTGARVWLVSDWNRDQNYVNSWNWHIIRHNVWCCIRVETRLEA